MIRTLLTAVFVLCMGTTAMAGETVTYKDGATTLEGYLAKTDKPDAPVVIIFHQWLGVSDYEKGRADALAAAGYNAFVADMYGQGIRPKNTDEAGKLAGMYKGDPALARQRSNAALAYARTIPGADTSKIAAWGYCFGGTMALELARSGADLASVTSFHGALATKQPAKTPGTIKPSILVLHGADDPYVKPEEVAAFKDEMNAAKADWYLTEYAYAVHSFTEPHAGNDPSKGAAYNEKADKRSLQAAMDFLKETL